MTSLDEYSLNGKQITPSLIKHDIPEDLHKRAYEIAFNSLKKYTAERDIAEYVKKIFDQEFLPSWQCIVGKDFAVGLSHESENFIFFSIENMFFLIFKL